MPGFKPRPDIAFRDIYIAINRLHAASTNAQQEHVIANLLKGLKTVEPLWGVGLTDIPNRRATSKAEAYLEAEQRVLDKYGITKPPKPPEGN